MEQPLLFYNMDFEKVVRDELNIYSKPIYPADVAGVKELCCADFSFSPEDYETLYTFTNLEALIFEQHTGIIDFSIFVPLKNLKYLTVGGDIFSEIKLLNIEALKELQDIEYLSVCDFGEINLANIGEVQQLKELCIGWGHRVTNPESIPKIKSLTLLELYDISIQNLDFLDDLSSNLKLCLGGLDMKENFDITNLKRFKSCEYEFLSINGKFI